VFYSDLKIISADKNLVFLRDQIPLLIKRNDTKLSQKKTNILFILAQRVGTDQNIKNKRNLIWKPS